MVLSNLVQSNKKADDIHQRKWNGLDGKTEAGETSDECVIREALEESGLSIQNPKYCGQLMFPKIKGNDGKSLDLNLWESDHIFLRGSMKVNYPRRSLDIKGTRCAVMMWSSIPIKLRV